jgi:hypothetical protein
MKPKPTTWSDNEKRALVRLVRNGATMKELTAKLRRYTRSVRAMAKTMGLLIKK